MFPCFLCHEERLKMMHEAACCAPGVAVFISSLLRYVHGPCRTACFKTPEESTKCTSHGSLMCVHAEPRGLSTDHAGTWLDHANIITTSISKPLKGDATLCCEKFFPPKYLAPPEVFCGLHRAGSQTLTLRKISFSALQLIKHDLTFYDLFIKLIYYWEELWCLCSWFHCLHLFYHLLQTMLTLQVQTLLLFVLLHLPFPVWYLQQCNITLQKLRVGVMNMPVVETWLTTGTTVLFVIYCLSVA